MSKTCECGKTIKENYKMCFKCSQTNSILNVSKNLQNKHSVIVYKKNKDLPTLNKLQSLMDTIKLKIREGDEYKCSCFECENVLVVGKKHKGNYTSCYPCYLTYYKENPKKNDIDDFIDD